MKAIKINGKIVEMDFEQCYCQFAPLRNKLVNQFWYMPIEREDLMQEVDLNFLKAYKSYNIDSGFEFITVAYKSIINSLWKLNNKFHTKKRQSYEGVVHLNELSQTADNPSELIDLLVQEDNFVDDLHCKLAFSNILKKIKREDKVKAINLLRFGYKQREIAEILGCSQIQISRFKCEFKELFINEMCG